MPTRTIPLTELVMLFRQMTGRTWRDGRLCGELCVPDQATADFLRELLDEGQADHYPCEVVEGDPDNVRVGDLFHLCFGRVRTAIGLIAPDVDTLLRNTQVASGTETTHWYVVDRDEASWEADKEIPRRLQVVHQFVKALEGTASIFDARNARIVFLRDGRLDVPIQFDGGVLLACDEKIAQEMITQLKLEDGHTDQRHEICATAICEMLSGQPKEQRFAALLRGMAEFRQRFVDGYKLFAASFSFEKVRDQAESIRIEYLGKIHKTFSDIQGQLLGIPISTIVVATQFKDVETLTGPSRTGQMWINVAVIAGAFIFCIFLTLAALNQKHTLDVLEEEIDRHKKALEEDHADIKARLDSIFVKLTNRATLHRIGLWIVFIVCWVSFFFGLSVFWVLTRGAF